MNVRFTISFLMLLIFQILLCSFLHLTPYLYLSILPLLILCIPLRISTLAALFIAFGCGLATDLLADGLTGLNSFALVPVAMLRKPIVKWIFGTEMFARKEDISIKRNGIQKMAVAIAIAQSIFMIIYVWADAAGSRSLWFCLARIAVSVIVGTLVSLAMANLLVEEENGRWN